MNKQETNIIVSLIGILLSLTLIALSSIMFFEAAILCFTFGSTTTALLSIFLFQFTKKYNTLQKFRNNRSGMAWIWAVALLAIIFLPLVYWAVGWPFDIVATQVQQLYTLTGTMAYAWIAVRALISYLLAFALFFIAIWAIVNAKSPGGG